MTGCSLFLSIRNIADFALSSRRFQALFWLIFTDSTCYFLMLQVSPNSEEDVSRKNREV